MNNIATALLKQGKFEESYKKAEEAYQYGKEHEGTATFQDLGKALMKSASALRKMGKYEEAIAKCKDSLLENRDKTVLALENEIQDELEKDKIKKQYNPEGAMKMKEEGNQLVKDKKFIDAAQTFTKGIEMLPEKM